MPDWRLYWRDDGSADETVAIMEAFARAGRGPLRSVAEPGHLGATASFWRCCGRPRRPDCRSRSPTRTTCGCRRSWRWRWPRWAWRRRRRCIAAARCWSTSACKRSAKSAPCCRPPGFPAALTQNIATGCTVVLNPAAAAPGRGQPAAAARLHDWWSYLLVTASGGRVIADPTPTVLYRQHRGNLVGAPPSIAAAGAGRRCAAGPGVFMDVLRRTWPRCWRNQTCCRARRAGAGRGGPRPIRWAACAAAALRLPGLCRQTLLETMLFRWWFLVG